MEARSQVSSTRKQSVGEPTNAAELRQTALLLHAQLAGMSEVLHSAFTGAEEECEPVRFDTTKPGNVTKRH